MHTFMVPCLLGLEKLVGDEIRRLGLKDVQVENGRVLCRGELSDLARLNINLRCGARVLLVLGRNSRPAASRSCFRAPGPSPGRTGSAPGRRPSR